MNSRKEVFTKVHPGENCEVDVRAPFKIYPYAVSTSSFDARTICAALARVATRHAETLGILHGFDPTRDCGWIILSINLRVLAVPEPHQRLTLETWVSTIEGATLIREFRIYMDDAKGPHVFVEAAQSFVLFDRDTRRPVVAPLEKRRMLRGGDRVFHFGTRLDRRTPLKNNLGPPRHQTFHTVSTKEVDHNNHLNHAEYLNWLSDHIDGEGVIGEWAIEYLREARLDDLLKIQSWKREQSTVIVFVDETNSTLSALAQFSPLQI